MRSIAFLVDLHDEPQMPVDEKLASFTEFGTRLAFLCGLPASTLIDGVTLPLSGQQKLDHPQGRPDLGCGAIDPALYTFEIVRDESGRAVWAEFVPTPACEDLAGHIRLDLIVQSNENCPGYTLACDQLRAALAERPDYLLGAAVRQKFLSDRDLKTELVDVSRAVDAAESMIPKYFDGSLDADSNWIYLDLLDEQMGLLNFQQDYAAVLSTALKLQRRATDDAYHMCYCLPFLFLDTGDAEAARRALAALDNNSSAFASLTRAFFAFREMRGTVFRSELAKALLDFPAIQMHLLQKPGIARLDDPRNVLEGPNTMRRFFRHSWKTYISTPRLRKACVAFLGEPDVLMADRESYLFLKRQPGTVTRGYTSVAWTIERAKWVARLTVPPAP